MALKMENVLASVLVFAILTSMMLAIYSGFTTNYGLTPDPDSLDASGKSVITRLNELNLVSNINSTITSLHQIASPTGSVFDIVGAFLSTGVGFLKTATSVITLPFEIFDVFSDFYTIPSGVYTLLGLLFSLYIGFLLLNKMTG